MALTLSTGQLASARREPSLPQRYFGLMDRCLATDPDARPTMGECAKELKALAPLCTEDSAENEDVPQGNLIREMLTPAELSDAKGALARGEPAASVPVTTACVIFADMVGLTHFTAAIGHAKSNALLQKCFGEFDSILARHGLMRIDLIGDMIIAASGLKHKERGVGLALQDVCLPACAAALEMLAAAALIPIDLDTPSPGNLTFRFGIAAGGLSATLVGSKIQLIGDAVNTSSRLESAGVPCKIQVPETVKLACQTGSSDRGLTFVPRPHQHQG